MSNKTLKFLVIAAALYWLAKKGALGAAPAVGAGPTGSTGAQPSYDPTQPI